MGRLSHLRRTLPTWVEHTSPDTHIYVVDQECPDGAGAWAASEYPGRVTAVASKALHSPSGRALFHKSAAQNAGARAAREADVLAFLDADTRVMAGFGNVADRRREFTIAEQTDKDLTGLLIVQTSSFFKAGGFDEAFTEYGSLDIALRLRLYGLERCYRFLPRRFAAAIHHGDDLRLRNHSLSVEEANTLQFERILKHALTANISRNDFLGNPSITRLLGFKMTERQP